MTPRPASVFGGSRQERMDETRKIVDALEAEVADEDWPLPTYTEMLFIK